MTNPKPRPIRGLSITEQQKTGSKANIKSLNKTKSKACKTQSLPHTHTSTGWALPTKHSKTRKTHIGFHFIYQILQKIPQIFTPPRWHPISRPIQWWTWIWSNMSNTHSHRCVCRWGASCLTAGVALFLVSEATPKLPLTWQRFSRRRNTPKQISSTVHTHTQKKKHHPKAARHLLSSFTLLSIPPRLHHHSLALCSAPHPSSSPAPEEPIRTMMTSSITSQWAFEIRGRFMHANVAYFFMSGSRS